MGKVGMGQEGQSSPQRAVVWNNSLAIFSDTFESEGAVDLEMQLSPVPMCWCHPASPKLHK